MILVALFSVLVHGLVRLMVAYLVMYFIIWAMLFGLGVSAAVTGQPVLLLAVLLVLFWPHLKRLNRREVRVR